MLLYAELSFWLTLQKQVEKISGPYESTGIMYVLPSYIRMAKGVESMVAHKFLSIQSILPTMALICH